MKSEKFKKPKYELEERQSKISGQESTEEGNT